MDWKTPYIESRRGNFNTEDPEVLAPEAIPAKEYRFSRLHSAIYDLIRPSGGVAHPHSKFVKKLNEVFAISCLVAFAIDPVFFFVIFVDKTDICAEIDWPFTIGLMIVRTVSDLVFVTHIFVEFRTGYAQVHNERPFFPFRTKYVPISKVEPGDIVSNRKDIAGRYFRRWFLWDVLSCLALPQIIMLVVLFSGSSLFATSSDLRSFLQISVLLQNIPRLARFLPFLTGSYHANGFLFESGSSRFVLNLVVYAMASHVLGCIWYLLGVSKILSCLENNCTEPQCQVAYLSCLDARLAANTSDYMSWKSSTMIDEVCLKAGSNSSNDYGLYSAVLPIGTQQNGLIKYSYSLFWGFQQLTTLGGNQMPSASVSEVTFGIVVILVGLLLFTLLIGNIQMFLSSLSGRTFHYQMRQRDLGSWMGRNDVPTSLQKRVRDYERLMWSAHRGVPDQDVLESLPEDLRQDLSLHLCGHLIKKSELLREMDSRLLDAFCMRMKKEAYLQSTVLLKQGSPVSKLYFVVRGELLCERAGGLHTSAVEQFFMGKGSFFGDELLLHTLESMVSRASVVDSQGSLSFPQIRRGFNASLRDNSLPVAERSVTCDTAVEVFALEASDLAAVCRMFPSVLQSSRMQRVLNKFSVNRQQHAAKSVQVYWRYFVRRKYNINLEDFMAARYQGRVGRLFREAARASANGERVVS